MALIICNSFALVAAGLRDGAARRMEMMAEVDNLKQATWRARWRQPEDAASTSRPEARVVPEPRLTPAVRKSIIDIETSDKEEKFP